MEVKLGGHARLASGHVLMGGRTAVRFRTRQAGILSVSRDRDGYALSLPAWPTGPRPLPELAAAMGGDILEPQWREGGYATFLYRDPAAIRPLDPDFATLTKAGPTPLHPPPPR